MRREEVGNQAGLYVLGSSPWSPLEQDTMSSEFDGLSYTESQVTCTVLAPRAASPAGTATTAEARVRAEATMANNCMAGAVDAVVQQVRCAEEQKKSDVDLESFISRVQSLYAPSKARTGATVVFHGSCIGARAGLPGLS